ncbi:hypothetical protein ES319_D01G130700v1 [Gossypium barbadense]|uniref:Uncharacterized protein n=3 Tax=Gossypium TaxID=3633 RepID=A0A5J5STE2_GOSBA|nr:hypothetical protein ES319_D01G130700v1 [Gossypium barbadense]TYG83093.1 hypothetical protein ES288_D01G141000v1 [Gossypium darwinii]TYH87767.1 hypothetical protein ES332_D01G141800v1 [Gossypium tomentosum]
MSRSSWKLHVLMNWILLPSQCSQISVGFLDPTPTATILIEVIQIPNFSVDVYNLGGWPFQLFIL